MVTEESFEIGGDGTVAQSRRVAAPVPVAGDEPDTTGIDQITQMIVDPESDLADIMRLIALEIARTMKQMTAADPLQRGSASPRELNDRIKAYRELQKTLTESDQLSKKDTLNLDGPKFKYVFVALVGFFKAALQNSGVDDELTQNTMLQFADLVRTNDESMRRELSKIESGR